jgi:tape measure domain-containing protein
VAADTTYTIRLVDQATSAGKRVEKALAGTARAASRTAAAYKKTDKAERKASREAERLAKVELKLAKSLSATARAAISNSRAMGRLAVKTDKAKVATAGLSKATARLGKVATVSGKATKNLSKESNGITRAAALAGAAMGTYMAVGAVRTGVEMVKANASAELLRDTFNRVAGNKTEFPAIQKQIRALGLDMVEGEKAALNLRTAFGSVTTTKFISLFKAAQLSAENTKRVAVQLNQIQGRGLIQGENLNTIVEGIPGLNRGAVAQAVADELNITRQAAAKKLQSGKLASDIGIRAIFKGTLDALKIKDLDKFNEKLSKTTLTRVANIGNDVTEAKRSIGKALERTDFIAGLAGLSSGLRTITADLGPSGLSTVLGTVTAGVVGLGVALAGAGLKAAFGAIVAGTTAATAPLWLIAGAVGGVAASVFLVVKAVERLNSLGGIGEALMFATGNAQVAQATIGGVVMGPDGKPAGKKKEGFDLGALFSSPRVGFGASAAPVDPGFGQDFQTARDLADGTMVEAGTSKSSGPSRAALGAMGANAAAAVSQAKGRGGTVGKVEVNINVDGSKDPLATGAAVKEELDTGLSAFFERHLEGVGA